MKSLYYIFLLPLFLYQPCAFAQSGNNGALLSSVDTHILRGQPKKALKILSQRIASSPDNLELRTKRAEVNLILLKKNEARKELISVLNKNDSYGLALLAIAEYHMQVNHMDSALWYIEKALSYEHPSPVMENLYGLKGNILMQMKDFDEAESNLFMAINRTEVSIGTMRDFAAILSRNGKYNNALMVLEESMLMFGEHLEPLINTGYVCNQLEKYDEAIVHLKKALIQDPHQPIAHTNIAEAYLHQGSVTLAHKHIEKSLDNDKMNPYAYKVNGDILLQMNQPDKACKAYKRAYMLDFEQQYDEVSLIKIINEICGNDGIDSKK